ncbi:hypothetical protein RN001_012400 [Aquatica leii]|uniref:DUF4806 domain-containing protein n=1 Tax=Aquatica leii TaxID=1421715 RepID=A0AAN7P5E8_9COLE|nr:hypothetical protein RN001_012400 [Aquatica leii]
MCSRGKLKLVELADKNTADREVSNDKDNDPFDSDDSILDKILNLVQPRAVSNTVLFNKVAATFIFVLKWIDLPSTSSSEHTGTGSIDDSVSEKNTVLATTLLEARRKTRNVEDDRNWTNEEEYRRLRKPSKCNFASIVNINLTSTATDYSNSPSPASSGICSEEVPYDSDNLVAENEQSMISHNENHLKKNLPPLNSIEEVEDFEVALENEQIKSKYVAHLKIFSTSKLDVTIRNCLNSVYTSTLATKCAWTRLKNKYSIKDLKQIAIIEGVVRQYHRSITKNEFKVHVFNWFRRAATRLNRETLKSKPNDNQVNKEVM